MQDVLDRLQLRIDQLIRRQAALQTENRELKAKLADKESALSRLQQELQSAGRSVLVAGIAASRADSEEKQRLRRELDSLIAEIDKILTTLND